MKKGILILQFWCVANLFPALFSLFYIAFGKHAPALQMTHGRAEIEHLNTKILDTVDGLGVMTNTLIIAYCVSSFFIISQIKHTAKTLPLGVFTLSVLLVQTAGYVSDWLFYGGENLHLLHFSSLIVLVGLVLCVVPAGE